MFIKVFVPNVNGKIELTVQELEALLKDAAAKAVSEKCANCNKGNYLYNSTDWNSIQTYPNITISEIKPTTSNPEDNIAYLNGGLSFKEINNPNTISYNKKTDPSYLTYTTRAESTTNKGE